MKLFFQNRLSISELFKLRHDEYYILEMTEGQKDFFGEEGHIENIKFHCGDKHYFDFKVDDIKVSIENVLDYMRPFFRKR